VGLIGPNGSGKTTTLKAILGLTAFDGELSVLGMNPRTQRDALMNDVCFIADVAILPLSEGVVAALAKRGTTDMSVVFMDTWPYGEAVIPRKYHGRRPGGTGLPAGGGVAVSTGEPSGDRLRIRTGASSPPGCSVQAMNMLARGARR